MKDTKLLCVLNKIMSYLYAFYHTFWRDLRAYCSLITLRFDIMKAISTNSTIDTFLEKHATKQPLKVAFVTEEKSYTFIDVHQYANRIANVFTKDGFKSGDNVALFMPSIPEYSMTWYGLSKIGVVPALINENLRAESLIHCITCVKPKALIFHSEFEDAIREIVSSLETKTQLLYYVLPRNSGKINAIDLQSRMNEESGDSLIARLTQIIPDPLLYIFTSGTTGYPKASIMRHNRALALISLIPKFIHFSHHEILYNCLPLYHSIGTGATLLTFVFGQTIVIRPKFSASKFWEDCIKFDCTAALYIGELTTYLLAQPVKITDKSHKVKNMLGVGLRESMWQKFIDRFNISNVLEIYGSSEGNTTLFNFDNTPGACGFIPICTPKFIRKLFFRATLIKVNEDTGEPIRNKIGFCINCEPGETGMIVGKIIKTNPLTSFDGYTDENETEKKIIRNVFEKGDQYFLSGDVLHMDRLGYIYFRDRLGDTYRWKGENVSTTQVEDVVRNILGVVDCVVYGVKIPNMDGCAGMLAVVDKGLKDFDKLYKQLIEKLPKYSIPIFIRIATKVELTGTFKFSKVQLKKEGFDIDVISDPIYMLDTKKQTYLAIDRNMYDELMNGKIVF